MLLKYVGGSLVVMAVSEMLFLLDTAYRIGPTLLHFQLNIFLLRKKVLRLPSNVFLSRKKILRHPLNVLLLRKSLLRHPPNVFSNTITFYDNEEKKKNKSPAQNRKMKSKTQKQHRSKILLL